MNIENLTIKEAREIAAMFSAVSAPKESFLKNYIGKHVIVRSSNEGINFGLVEDIDESGVVISTARRIWYHKPADPKTAWYEGVANTGLSRDSKVSVAVPRKVIVEKYSLTLCSDAAIESIHNHPAHATN